MLAQEMNSQEWWDSYFKTQWDANDGRNQTRGFMRTLLLNLPDQVMAYLLSNNLSLLDWGCAKGEGVDALATSFPRSSATGLDFSKEAISAARQRFPHLAFIQTDDGAIPGEFDVIVTSNCLEHFSAPLDIARTHLDHCRAVYITLVPYDEHELIEQHESRFTQETFPKQISDFTRFCSFPVDVPAIYWPDQQLLTVYVRSDLLGDVTREYDPAEMESLASERERLRIEEQAVLYGELSRLRGEVTRMWHEEVAPRDTIIAELRNTNSNRDEATDEPLRLQVERDRIAQKLEVWREKALYYRKQRTIERNRATELEARATKAETERDAYYSQVQFMSSTKAWRLSTAYWQLRGQGVIGTIKLLLLATLAIVLSPIFVPLVILALIVRLLYKVFIPYSVRLRIWKWRTAAFSRRRSGTPLMSLHSYAFVRYKRLRASISPGGVASLRTPATTGMVSVILPVYNGADMLRESLASILSQTYQNFELIAINDGSTDDSADILEEYAQRDSRIRVLHQENRKIPRTLSRGARAAQGEFLTWTSCDNRMKPDFLAKLVGSLERHPDWDMAYANMDIIGEDGLPLRNSGWYEGYQQPSRSEHIFLPRDVSALNVDANNYVGGAFMYRSRAAWLLGDYSFIRFTTEDYDYWMRMNSLLTLRHADFDTPIYEYRFHSASLTAKDRELGITASRPKLMAFEDFRRDFQLSPIIWVIESSDDDAASQGLVSRLRKIARERGNLILSSAQLATYQLPKLWAPTIYLHVARNSDRSLRALESLPEHALRVLVIAREHTATDPNDDPPSGWDMCVAMGASTRLHHISDECVGWYGSGDPLTLMTAIDIRARSHHESLIEREIDRCASQPHRRKVSFVICAFKRPDPVIEAVRSLANQTLSQTEYEVIVVNNDSADTSLIQRIATARQEWFAEHPDCLRYVDNPIKGLSSARNAGISEAQGEFVSFLDDDAIAPATFAEYVSSVLGQRPTVGLLGGHIRLVSVTPQPDALQPGFEPYWGHYQTAYDKLTIVDDWTEFPWGSNWTARRLALLHIGGFRTRYGRLGANFGGGEELVAAALIQSLGYEIAVSPDSEVLHVVEPHRFTWEHVRKTIIAGTLSQYMMELDLYIPTSIRMSATLREAFMPRIAPQFKKGRIARSLRSYRRRANISLLEQQWQHRSARKAQGLDALDSIRVSRR